MPEKTLKSLKNDLRNFYKERNVEVSELELTKLLDNYLYVKHIIKTEN